MNAVEQRDVMLPHLFMGVDGGGSGLRVILADVALTIHGEAHGPAANPSTVGRERAAALIREAMQKALGDVPPEQVAAVGIGVAGAAASHSAAWLVEVVRSVLPQALVVPSADYEIALVGALGRREGVLILAGTGSLVYAVNAQGHSALVGGWGYLLGDEGSGYWLGLEGLRAILEAEDGLRPPTILRNRLLPALGAKTPRDLIPCLYGEAIPPIQRIAGLAPLVLSAAAEGDAAAYTIVERGAQKLAEMAHAAMRRLEMASPRMAFAGGVLSERNPLSEALQRRLGLREFPRPLYPPAMGAILLAREAFLHTQGGKPQ
ncbi:MAG: hypothetical protein H5T70_00035 [Chloroflexi bacterium]|nr:hypothetical protein [Chloroflexota bacterium]